MVLGVYAFSFRRESGTNKQTNKHLPPVPLLYMKSPISTIRGIGPSLEVDITAVSYTHLTLPTILRV